MWHTDLWQVCMPHRILIRPYTRFKGYYYILTVIDVLSKHAWAVPLKIKSGNEMATVIAKIIGDDGRKICKPI